MSIVTTGKLLNQQGRALLRDLNAEVARAAKTPGVDEVHDLRVAIRRYRRMLAGVKPWFAAAESRAVRQELKKMMACAGAVRDCDVAMHLLEKTVDSKPAREKISEEFRKPRAEAAKALALALSGWTGRGLPPATSSPARRNTTADVTARRVLPALAKDFFRRGRKAARRKASADTVHKCRIAAKNLRYTLDIFSPLYGGTLDGLIGELKDLQTLLGDIHDCAVVRAMLDGGNASGDVKEFRSALKKKHHKKMKEFIEQYADDFSSPEKLSAWRSRLRAVTAP